METLAPPVVVVVVTHDPGPWFETTLEAIGGQDYPEVSVLVLDAASGEDPTGRVAAALPDAFVRRLEANEGFGATANAAISMVEGADFLVFSHDDVAPEPDALRHMVEEAYRSNAGVVGPKLVEWDRPDRLLHVGVEVDKSGAVADRVERGEVDQAQHDAVRDVFSTPGGFTLVRRDLFVELGGFDPHLVVMGEDLDLCWRAQIAGARVIVAPDARVRHLELLASGRRENPTSTEPAGDSRERSVSLQELQRRGELHAALKAYGPAHRVRVIPQIAVLAAAEILVFVVTGRRSRASAVAGAWRWNFRLRSAIRRERTGVQAYRRVSDTDVRRLQMSGSDRVRRYLRRSLNQGLAAAHIGPDAVVAESHRIAAFRRPSARMVAWTALLLVVVFGARTLLTDGLPVVGQLLRVPPPGSLMAQFADGQQVFGAHTADTTTPATLLIAIVGYLLFGSVGLLQTVLVLGCLPVGAFGVARLCRNFASPWAPLVGAATYLAVPLPYDDIATGRLDALFAYAAIPWLMLGLARASELRPFEPRAHAPGTAGVSGAGPLSRFGRPIRRTLLIGAVLALLLAFDPSGGLVFALLGAGLALGILITAGDGVNRAAIRVALTAIGALAMSILLLAPWSISVLTGTSPAVLLAGTRPGAGASFGWGDLLRLSPGPIGMTALVFGLLAAAALPLLIGRSWRLGWSGRAWICALVAWFFALAVERGWTGSFAVLPGEYLPIAACGIAMSAALGVSAFRADLPGSRFGWRQIALVVAAAGAVLGALPVIAATAGGRFDLPPSGFNQALSWMSSGSPANGPGVLWLGDSAVVPGKAWPLAAGLGYLVLPGVPDLTSLWQRGPTAGDTQVARDVKLAWSGRTVELGHLIALNSVKYVVVVGALAPDIPGLQEPTASPPPESLVSALDAQSDLRQLPTEGGYDIYINPEYAPSPVGRAVAAPGANGFEVAGELVFWVVFAALIVALGPRRPGRRVRSSSVTRADRPAAASGPTDGRTGQVARRDQSGAVVASTGAARG